LPPIPSRKYFINLKKRNHKKALQTRIAILRQK
jgi:hypothetical protein